MRRFDFQRPAVILHVSQTVTATQKESHDQPKMPNYETLAREITKRTRQHEHYETN